MQGTETGNNNLTILSGVSALVSIGSIQPLLTFAASLIAIVSGLYSIYIKHKKNKS
jgi:hypothetical protein